MRLHDYQKAAARTISTDFHIMSGKGVENDYDLIHACLGLSSEIAEIAFDQENKLNVHQEIGDGMWYTALGCTAIGIDMEDLDLDFENDDTLMDLVVQSGIIADKIKRTLFYGAELDRDIIIRCFGCIVKSLDTLAVTYGTTLETCMEKNIAKLKTRYPEKFTAEAAINRNVAREERHFEEEA
jgi:NTP pyrophosphatase (non-canonical NTP hydrolase)